MEHLDGKKDELSMNNSCNADCVMILPESVEESDEIYAMKLCHPHTKSGVIFLLDYKNKKVFELNSIEAGQRSFFINENVMSNGDITFATAFDPIYLILPYLMSATENTSLEDILEDQKYPKMTELAHFFGNLSCIADKIGCDDLNVWKYNEKLTLQLLTERINSLEELLKQNKEQIVTGNFIKKLDSDAYLRMAHGILSEYLCEELSKKLKIHLNIPEEPKLQAEEIKSIKKLKITEPSDDFSKDSPAVKAKEILSAKAKSLAKSAKGTKSIMSYFKQK